MEPAVYPAKKCREAVWNDHGMSYPCELANLHTGPCASLSVQRTVVARDRWEADHPHLVGESTDGGDIIL